MQASLLEILVQQKIITIEQAKGAHELALVGGRKLIRHLIDTRRVTERKLVEFFSRYFSLQEVMIEALDPRALELVPPETIVRSRVLPFQLDADGTLRVAIADPTDLAQVEILRARLGRPVVAMFTTLTNLEAALERISDAPLSAGPPRSAPASTATPRAQLAAAPSLVPQQPAHAPRSALPATAAPQPPVARSPAPSVPVRKFRPQDQVVNILNQILLEAVTKGASDVHLEPQAKQIVVRFRYEGVLYDVFEIPIELKDQLANRVKVTANLDIAERKLPQDGRASVKIGAGDVNFRTSVMPSFYGENIVFRILKQSDIQLDVGKLGLDSRQLGAFRSAIEAPNGLFLVTGPTGAGKTTTLYSALSSLNNRGVKITTVEDPVEYHLSGITQVQVNKETGLDFAEVLKGLLRQDPDILLVGEIRDQETAATAVQAALTGHLVMSSMHTNDAASAVHRLLNMKVEPFAVLSAINTVVAQRLIRRICTHCAERIELTREQINYLGNDRVIVENCTPMRGRGCDHCLGGGYRGRAAIFEVLELTEDIKEMFLKGENIINIKRNSFNHGTTTLRQSALAMVAAGQTTLEEAIASTLEH